MAKRKPIMPPAPDELTHQAGEFDEVFALENVTQLRQAIDQAVYGPPSENKPDEAERTHTVEGLTTLGQLGLLTETDLDEAKKGYL